jgi:cell division protein FtsI (penicillin-binding protein 3)
VTRDAHLPEARRRLRLIGGAFVVAFLALGLRLVDLALMSVDAATEAHGVAGEPQSARRADIVDRHGDLIATDYPKTSLFADPAEVLDPAATATRLARVLSGVDRGDLLRSLSAPRRFVWLKRHLVEAERRAVVRLGLPGVGFRTEWHRVYPQRELTAHLVGYVGIENQGLAGIEYSFEDRLTGPGAAAGPLALTIDLGVQEAVRSELAQAVERFRASGGTGLVLDARSGEILAMVSLPDFDPNRYWQAPSKARFNRNTQGTYELGSLFKLFTLAMALDSGVVDIAGGYDATKPLVIGRHRIHDFHAKRRWLSVPEIMAFSSNIGAAKMAYDVGAERQHAYFARLGLLERHPIRLPEVGSPQVPSPWRPINTVTAAYGHGIAVSPLQVVDAVAAAICPAPPERAHLVQDGAPVASRPPAVSADTAAKLRWLMWLTVAEGTGKQAAVPGYLIGGKTGSADKPGPRGYRGGGLLASFVGAFPIDRPRYVVLVTLDDPKGDAATYNWAQGGWTAAPTVGRIIGRIGPLLGLPPAGPEVEPWFRERLLADQSVDDRTGRREPRFAAAPHASWLYPAGGGRGCSCADCSIQG